MSVVLWRPLFFEEPTFLTQRAQRPKRAVQEPIKRPYKIDQIG
jgi:hypothetical protein